MSLFFAKILGTQGKLLLMVFNVRIWNDTITKVFHIFKASNSQIIDISALTILLWSGITKVQTPCDNEKV